MKKYFQIAFLVLGIVTAPGFFFSESRAAASDLMFGGRIESCNGCHAEILEEIGQGEHMGEPLDQGRNYARCAGCHAPHPEIEGPPVNVHQFSRFGHEQLCAQCHFSGNKAKAAAMVLPPKSVMCAACHISDFTVDDPITIISLALLLAGILGLAAIWFSGNVEAEDARGIIKKTADIGRGILQAIFSVRLLHALNALFLDAILQRKLYNQSRFRWAIHGLIFFPMLIRLCWGFFAVVFAHLMPEHPMVLDMMNKNHPVFGSLIFELTGWLAVAGIIIVAMRKTLGAKKRVQGLPAQGRISFYILGSILIMGFILKIMRIAMTGFPDGSETAFFSYNIAFFFDGFDHLTELYGYVWYIHAVLVGLFVACLPFSRMFHMVMGPVAVIIQAMQKPKKIQVTDFRRIN